MFRPMVRARIIAFATDPPPPALSALAASPVAAWLIDVTDGRLLAANAAGADAIGQHETGVAPLLDASMPALARLRVLAAGAREEAEAEPLLLWTAAGAHRIRCRISFQRSAAHVLAVVQALTEAAPETGAQRADEAAAVPHALRASLAHELKTPLSAIAAAAEIMKDERLGPLGTARYGGYAADIYGSAQHALGVIDRMLGGRAGPAQDAAGQAFDFAELDPAALLRAAVSQLAPLAERAGIALTLELTPRLPHVVADATSLRQIVFNLVTNALKFTGEGGRVTVAARYAGDGPLTISVSDTGSGMTESEVARLLAPDPGARPARTRAADGTTGLGLGLPLVQALARANGAELVIESAPGRGTSASVVLGKDRVIPV